MSKEEQDSLTADEIRSKGLRVCYVVDSDDFITDEDQEQLPSFYFEQHPIILQMDLEQQLK